MPSLAVVAGPNGSGKSTLTRNRRFQEFEIIDPDAIAREMAAGNGTGIQGLEMAAAREALRRQRAALAAGRSFLVETTLAGRGPLRLLESGRRAGFRNSLHYVCVNSADQAVDRVRNRVSRGGHDVPESDVRRRFARSLANLPPAILLSDETHLYDNSLSRKPHRAVFVANASRRWTASRCPEWAARAISDAATIRRGKGQTTERGMGQDF